MKRGQHVGDLLLAGGGLVEASAHLREPPIDLVETPVDLLETCVDLLEACVDLLEAAIDPIEAFGGLYSEGIDRCPVGVDLHRDVGEIPVAAERCRAAVASEATSSTRASRAVRRASRSDGRVTEPEATGAVGADEAFSDVAIAFVTAIGNAQRERRAR